MADYPLKQIAEEVQKILDTALTVNNSYPQTLTEEEKAITREKIGASAIGEGIKIISHFDTLEELVSTITKPSAGDAYSVGTEIPYRLYVYDFLREDWRDYGPIRSTDIKARFAQNVAVSTSAWKADADVFEDYTYKAQIPLGEVTGSDFPIVAFAPSDAVSGNFCPIAYCFDGYVEIWARAVPTEAITIPAITFIIQDDGASGGSTKGITNASGGIATGGIGSEQIADGSMTTAKYAPKSVTREKLANDALYSPVRKPTTTSYDISASDVGYTIIDVYNVRNSALAWNMSKAVADAFPIGTEIAFLRSYNSVGITLNFTGLRIVNSGTGQVGSASKTLSFSLPDRGSMCAIKKLENDSTYGSFWILTGNVEVVS